MPGLPSDKNDMPYLQTSWYDLVIPDYYGYARSEGLFTLSGCIQTVLDTAQTFCEGTVLDVRWNTSLQVRYDHIIIAGASFGGRVACMSPKFDTSLKEVVLCYPWIPSCDWWTWNYIEETLEQYHQQCRDWFGGLLRFADENAWNDLYNEKWPFAANKYNIDHLHDVSVFAWHGTADEVIHYTRTRDFCTQLFQRNPDGTYQYVEYYGLGHGWLCRQAIMQGWLWSKQKG